MVSNIDMICGKIGLIMKLIKIEYNIKENVLKICLDGVRFLFFKCFFIKYYNCLGVKNKVFLEEREIFLRDLEKNIFVNLLFVLGLKIK